MKKLKLLFVVALMLTATKLSAQLYIDGENASVYSNGDLRDNGRTLKVAKQGNNVVNPWITGYKRSGSKGVGYRINGATSGDRSQRVETAVNVHWSDPDKPIAEGETWYTGFSVMLSNDAWPTPTNWMVIHQTQQVEAPGQSGNYPIAGLYMRGNKLVLTVRSGKNGNSARNPSPVGRSKDIWTLQKGVWYDIVVGWKFSPNSSNGWAYCWIKKASQNRYTQIGMSNIYMGYWEPPSKILQNKIGLYRGRVNQSHKLYFDEVRFAKYFNGAKIPGGYKSTNASIEEESEFSGVTLYPNPAKDHLNIQFTLENKSAVTVSILGIDGKQIAEYNHSGISGINNLRIDLTEQHKGMHLVKIEDENNTIIKKILIQ